MKPSFYHTKKISPKLLAEIKKELTGIKYGSIEIYVSNGFVCQITKRQIRKTTAPNNNSNKA